MTTPQPIRPEQHSQETIEGALRNALTIASVWADPAIRGEPEINDAFASITRLLKHALAGLGEPNESAVRAAGLMFGFDLALHNAENVRREARDAAAAVISAQLRGAL